MGQLPISTGLCWYDEAQTIMLVEPPPELVAEGFIRIVESALATLNAVPGEVAAVVDLRPVQPPPDAVSHFREMFDHPLLQHPRLEMIIVIVGGNRPMRVLTTVFRRLYRLFGTMPIYIVDNLEEALAQIESDRRYPRSQSPDPGQADG